MSPNIVGRKWLNSCITISAGIWRQQHVSLSPFSCSLGISTIIWLWFPHWMVIKWRVQWEIHISLESSYHKEDVKYQTMMWTIMLNSQFRTYWILLSTRLSNIPFFLVQLCVRCSWINLLSSFSSLYLIITRVTYVLVHQLMFWLILFLFLFFGSKEDLQFVSTLVWC